MSDIVLCPKCGSEYTYEQDNLMVCSQCFNEWDPEELVNEDKVLDSNGNELKDGDSVVVINVELGKCTYVYLKLAFLWK